MMKNKVYPSIKNSIVLMLLLFGIAIGMVLIFELFRVILKLPGQSIGYDVLIYPAVYISFGVVLLVDFKKAKRTVNDVFKLNKVSASLWVSIIVFMIGFVIVSSELDNLVNYVLPVPEMLRDIFETLMAAQIFVATIIIMGIMPEFMDEFFFRELFLNGLNRSYSPNKAVIISALLFGIAHLNPWQFCGTFIMWLISALMRIKTNSIVLGIYIYLFNNILYTKTVKYRGLIPIRDFNTNYAIPVEFQPVWFDIIGLVILVTGIISATSKNLK